jgi:hypothetical protein
MRRLTGAARRAGWPIALVGAAALVAAAASPPKSDARAAPVRTAATPLPAEVRALPAIDTVFRHQDHERVDCLSCHTVDPVHGEVRVRTLSDCRSCHHRSPLASDCARCHSAADAPAATLNVRRVLQLSVGAPPARELPFDHARHAGVTCASCHTQGAELSAAAVACASCHVEHHAPEARCATCHLPKPETPPHPLEVHVGCSGSGCHQDLPFEGVPRTRNLCLACHAQQEDHKPGQVCTTCHLLPSPRPAPGASREGEAG